MNNQNYNPLFFGLVLIVIVLSVIFLLGKNLTKVSLVGFDVDDIGNFTEEGFTAQGKLLLKNPSRISVPVDSVTYNIAIKQTSEVLSSGIIPSFVLEKNTITTVPFEQKIAWDIGLKKAFSLSRQDKVEILIQGVININIPGEISYEIPFEKTVDVKEQVKAIFKDKLSLW